NDGQAAKAESLVDARSRERRLESRLERTIVVLLEEAEGVVSFPLVVEDEPHPGVQWVVRARPHEVLLHLGEDRLGDWVLLEQRVACGFDDPILERLRFIREELREVGA